MPFIDGEDWGKSVDSSTRKEMLLMAIKWKLFNKTCFKNMKQGTWMWWQKLRFDCCLSAVFSNFGFFPAGLFQPADLWCDIISVCVTEQMLFHMSLALQNKEKNDYFVPNFEWMIIISNANMWMFGCFP